MHLIAGEEDHLRAWLFGAGDCVDEHWFSLLAETYDRLLCFTIKVCIHTALLKGSVMDVGRSSMRHRAGIVTEQNVKGARFVIVSRAVCELLVGAGARRRRGARQVTRENKSLSDSTLVDINHLRLIGGGKRVLVVVVLGTLTLRATHIFFSLSPCRSCRVR